jgi:hypothetical protein
MKTHSVLALAVCFLAATASTAAADEKSHAVMEHWVGDWSGNVAGAAETEDTPAHVVAEWMLDDKFIHAVNVDEDGDPVGIWLMHFDEKIGKYHVWYFTAALGASQWTGIWSDADKTMTWTGQSPDGTWRLAGYTKFVDNKQEWKLDITENGKTRTDTGSLERDE